MAIAERATGLRDCLKEAQQGGGEKKGQVASGIVPGGPGQPGLEVMQGNEGLSEMVKRKWSMKSGEGRLSLPTFEKRDKNWLLQRVKKDLLAC